MKALAPRLTAAATLALMLGAALAACGSGTSGPGSAAASAPAAGSADRAKTISGQAQFTCRNA